MKERTSLNALPAPELDDQQESETAHPRARFLAKEQSLLVGVPLSLRATSGRLRRALAYLDEDASRSRNADSGLRISAVVLASSGGHVASAIFGGALLVFGVYVLIRREALGRRDLRPSRIAPPRSPEYRAKVWAAAGLVLIVIGAQHLLATLSK